MAEYGAHHATHGNLKPTIFEVLGHDNLVSGLRSAFKFCFKVLAESSPERYGLLYQFSDEGYTIVDSVFQYIHLRLRGGLFTETFYGLKRVPDPRLLNVSKTKVMAWVFFSVVGPYLQSQMKVLYENLRTKQRENVLQSKEYRGLPRQLALMYLKVYPVYNFVSEMVVLGYYMAYALGYTDFHSAALHITSTRLAPVSMQDMDPDMWKMHIPKTQLRGFSTILWNWINGFVGGVTLTISLGAFMVQFLDWWYNQVQARAKMMAMPAPPPPKKWPCDVPSDMCSICKKKRTNDTALSSSGFVFCYPCIFKYVQETERCPVTGYKSSLNQLVKLYHQE